MQRRPLRTKVSHHGADAAPLAREGSSGGDCRTTDWSRILPTPTSLEGGTTGSSLCHNGTAMMREGAPARTSPLLGGAKQSASRIRATLWRQSKAVRIDHIIAPPSSAPPSPPAAYTPSAFAYDHGRPYERISAADALYTSEMARRRGEEMCSSFGPLYNYEHVSSPTPPSLPSPPPSPIAGTHGSALLARLAANILAEHDPFAEAQPGGGGDRLCGETREEVRTALATIFYPICKQYGASVDTAFLCNALLRRIVAGEQPHRAAPGAIALCRRDNRWPLYVALAMIGFKFNEESDPSCDRFGAIIKRSLRRTQPTFACPSVALVARMERRAMLACAWRIGASVTPLVLAHALLDVAAAAVAAGMAPCASARAIGAALSGDVFGKRRVVNEVDIFLGDLLAFPAGLDGVFSCAAWQWAIFGLATCLLRLAADAPHTPGDRAELADHFVKVLFAPASSAPCARSLVQVPPTATWMDIFERECASR